MHSYLVKLEDNLGNVHTIDRLSVSWVYGSPGRFAHPVLDQIRDEVMDLCKMFQIEPELKSNLAPTSNYAWTLHKINCKNGINVFVGFQNVGKNKEIEIKNIVRIEFNPNKVYEQNSLIDDLIRVLDAFRPREKKVNRLDYAIDIPVPLDNVVVLQSRKNKRSYDGTIYLGRRSSHGAVKIYDKQKESNLENPLTRFEITCKQGHLIKFDNVGIMKGEKMENEKMTSNTRTIVKMCLALKEAGYDYSDFIKGLNARKRKEVINFVEGMGQALIFDDVIFETIYKEVVERLNLGIEFPIMCNNGSDDLWNYEEDVPDLIPFCEDDEM